MSSESTSSGGKGTKLIESLRTSHEELPIAARTRSAVTMTTRATRRSTLRGEKRTLDQIACVDHAPETPDWRRSQGPGCSGARIGENVGPRRSAINGLVVSYASWGTQRRPELCMGSAKRFTRMHSSLGVSDRGFRPRTDSPWLESSCDDPSDALCRSTSGLQRYPAAMAQNPTFGGSADGSKGLRSPGRLR